MNKHDDRIYLSPPHLSGNEIQYVNDAINSNWIAPAGPDITKFEELFTKHSGMSCALAVSSCTAAIHLCLLSLGVKASDTVFCSDLTFAGSCNPIVYQNAGPVFIDSEPESSNMSPKALKKGFEWAKQNNRMPKAVIIVDLYGQSAKYDELLAICEQYSTPVIEDSAEALGAKYKGQPCGKFGKFGVYSFNGNKIITTSGGGIIISDDAEAVKRMKYLSTQAKLPYYYYEHDEIGYNYRMSNISAAIGRAQFEGLEQKVSRRREIYNTYRQGFCGLPLSMMNICKDGEPNYWLSVILIDEACDIKPFDIIQELEKNNIESRPVWKPMHMQPIYKNCKYFKHEGYSVSESLFARGVCLPSGSSLTDEQQQKVIGIVKNIFAI